MSVARPASHDARTSQFKDLGVSQWLCDMLSRLGIRQPTPVQQQCIPRILQGKDVLGQAKTGSGKTAAFAVPMLQLLSKDPYGCFGMILTPTRELAFQIAEQVNAFSASMNLSVCVVVGGMDQLSQQDALTRRPHVIVATPGRLASHVRGGIDIHCKHLQCLIFDEADRLLEDQFRPDLDTILSKLPPSTERQTLFFSATLSEALRTEALAFCDAKRKTFVFATDVNKENDVLVASLDQRYVLVPFAARESYLMHILQEITEKEARASVIVFVSTRDQCELMGEMLTELNIANVALHSKLNQSRRLAALGKFRSEFVRVLVATDVASRGLDIPTVNMVINFDIPRVISDYIHRVGRTARAGRGGRCVSFVTQYNHELFAEIEATLKRKMEEYKIKEHDALEGMKRVTEAKRLAAMRIERYESIANEKKPKRKNPSSSSSSSSSSASSDTRTKSKKKKKKKQKVTE